jgi:hypothetical protein
MQWVIRYRSPHGDDDPTDFFYNGEQGIWLLDPIKATVYDEKGQAEKKAFEMVSVKSPEASYQITVVELGEGI